MNKVQQDATVYSYEGFDIYRVSKLRYENTVNKDHISSEKNG
jgi:hypothetical protein